MKKSQMSTYKFTSSCDDPYINEYLPLGAAGGERSEPPCLCHYIKILVVRLSVCHRRSLETI